MNTEEAERKIEAGHIDWYDYCASVGHIPDNVKHMRSIVVGFQEWLNGGQDE